MNTGNQQAPIFGIEKENEMLERYFYLRKEKTVIDEETGKTIPNGIHRCGVVYLVMNEGGLTARGVSLCNGGEDPFVRDDGFLKEKGGEWKPFVGGLKLAKKRAMRALNSKANSEPITGFSAIEKVSVFNILDKSEYLPVLSKFELKILEEKKEA